MFQENSLTKLKQDLKDGDTIIYLDNLSNFTSLSGMGNGLIFWNYRDSTGYLYPVETYSRNVYHDIYNVDQIDKNNHTIQLKKTWSNGTIKEGTEVSQSVSGDYYNYCLMRGTIPNIFTKYQTILITSPTSKERNKTHYGAHFFKPLLVLNRYDYSESETMVTIESIVIEQVD